jgi:hypothetical protein
MRALANISISHIMRSRQKKVVIFLLLIASFLLKIKVSETLLIMHIYQKLGVQEGKSSANF